MYLNAAVWQWMSVGDSTCALRFRVLKEEGQLEPVRLESNRRENLASSNSR